MDNRTLGVAITSWQRYAETLESFIEIANDKRVSEIIIVDDFSDIEIFNKLKTAVSFCPKVHLLRNEVNYGCYLNKRQAVSLCTSKFVILFDSDNRLTKEYLDKIFEQEWKEDTILAPDFAMPNFCYQAFGGLTVDKTNVGEYMYKPLFSTCLNTCNLFVNTNKYLEVFDNSLEPVTCDSIYFAYCWLKAGYKIHITKGLQYPHLVHDKSHYKNFVHLTPKGLLMDIENNLKQMR